MIVGFYDALKGAENWFFGNLVTDSFISGCLDIFNAFILFAMFYALLLFPLRWCFNRLADRIRGLDDED